MIVISLDLLDPDNRYWRRGLLHDALNGDGLACIRYAAFRALCLFGERLHVDQLNDARIAEMHDRARTIHSRLVRLSADFNRKHRSHTHDDDQ